MKKIILSMILFLMAVQIASADIVQVSSGSSNELIITSISKGEIGFFNKITLAVAGEEEAGAGGISGGIGQINYTLIEKTTECTEGYQLWNDKCYECAGQLARSGLDIYCIECGDNGYWDGEQCVYSIFGALKEKAFIDFIVFLIPLTLLCYIIYRERKEKRKRLKRKKTIEEIEAELEEPEEEKPKKKIQKKGKKNANK